MLINDDGDASGEVVRRVHFTTDIKRGVQETLLRRKDSPAPARWNHRIVPVTEERLCRYGAADVPAMIISERVRLDSLYF